MSSSRLELIDKAFKKMDATGDGVITIEDLKRHYDVSQHPKYKTGEWTKDKVLQEFLNNFQADTDNVVSKSVFTLIILIGAPQRILKSLSVALIG